MDPPRADNAPSEVPRSIDNDTFFGTSPAPGTREPATTLPDDAFFQGPRPPTEAGFFTRAAKTPTRFGAILFAIGVGGILAQSSFLQQVVVGAPVFEEFAKFGLALVAVTALGARSVFARLPYAWLSGAAFGALEHATTYPSEPWLFYVERIAFHAGATGLSMASWTILEPHGDARVRWGSTIMATLVHWANNFGAIVTALAALVIPALGEAGLAWSILLTIGTFALTWYSLARRDVVGPAVAAALSRILSRFGPPAAPEPAPPEPTPPAATPAEPAAFNAEDRPDAASPPSTPPEGPLQQPPAAGDEEREP